MKNIINNKIILGLGLFALLALLPFAASAQTVPTVSYPSSPYTNVTATGATLNAIVNPNSSSTDVWFDVSSIGQVGSQNIGSGSSNVNVTYNLTGLQPNTIYTFQAKAMNDYGITNAPSSISFTTTALTRPTFTSVQTASITTTSAVISGAVNPGGSSTDVWFEASNVSGPLAMQNIGSGNSNVNVSYTLSNLSADTNYSFVLKAINDIDVASSSVINFKTLAAPATPTATQPSISTSSASSISSSSARLNASYNGNYANTYVRFAYGTSSSNLNNYTSYQSVGSGSGSTYETISVSEDTVYYFRAEAYNGVNSSSSSPIQGSVLNFTSDETSNASDPSISTESASGITNNSAILNGSYDANGAGTYTRFSYGTSSSNLNNYTSYDYQGTGSGSFSQTISNLSASTTYYFRAEGYNSVDNDNGSIYSFTTLAQSSSNSGQYPITVTKAVSNTKETSATLNGQATNSYALPVTAWFKYGTSLSLASQTSKQSIGSATSINFSANITGLKSNTIYYFRAVSENAGGQTLGEILVFKTGKTSSSSPSVGSSTSTPSVTPSAPVSAPEVSEISKALSITIETKADKLIPGATVEYFINYKNNAKTSISDVVLRVALPKNVVFERATSGNFTQTDNTLVINDSAIASGEEKVVFIQAKVGENVQSKETLLTTVTANYKNGSKSEDVLAYVIGEVGSAGSALTAAVIFGESGVLPNTPVEWIVLILVIAGLVILGRKIYLDNGKKKIQAAMPEGLPGQVQK